ncbi:MAG: glycosyltransferase [Paludibacteraceae bacterium]|nr:glycosyltransferase [Paludibacteraceae bacterium]
MITGLIISVLYACFVMACLIGVLKFNSSPRCPNEGRRGSVHVIISVYNEENRVETLIRDLVGQSFKEFDVTIIDDGSTDATLEKLNQFTAGLGNFSVMESEHKGKDTVIKEALRNIQDGLVIITDADCRHPQLWIESVVAEADETDASLLIGAVKIGGAHPLQATEFLSVQAVTIGSANINHPLICGGANLAFRAEAYRRVSNDVKENENGTDMFLLEAMKRSGEKIVAINSVDAVVETSGKESLREFLTQRGRWAKKSSKYTDYEIITIGVLNILMQVVLIVAAVCSVMHIELLCFWLLKFCIDAPLLSAVAIKFNTPQYIPLIPVVSLIYPFYVLTTLIYNFVKK